MLNQSLHKRVRVVYGKPGKIEVWSYPNKRTREIHVYVTTQAGEVIHIAAVVPR